MLIEKEESVFSLLQSTRRCLSLAIEMIETEQDCLELLYKIQAAQATMHKCGQILVQSQFQQSLETTCSDARSEIRCAELEHLVDLYGYYQEFS
jgi:DNA-binding FrmR family transcriptional regulator